MPLLSYKTCFVMFYLDIVAVTCSAVTGVFEKLINVPLPLSASLHSPATEICQTVLSFFFIILCFKRGRIPNSAVCDPLALESDTPN